MTVPASQSMAVAVAKINPDATQYLYFTYVDSAASDQIASLAVDPAGNAYIAGTTTNPNFPAFGGGALGTAPAGPAGSRAFVTKLNPQGVVLFSVLIGGSAASTARGIAITPKGDILVSGIAGSKGFPATPGAYSVADSTGQWFLMELDPSANKVVFSATGIGGSSIALDAGGNIYMAGSSIGADYPTTPGAYQTTFVQGYYCFGFCRANFPGNLQHVTKTDAAASKLIYSTGLNDANGAAGSTTNMGLAVDAAGNAYVTGTLFEGKYPFTAGSPDGATSYLTKLDPAGAHAIFSIPIGGGGVQLDASGALYVAGAVTSLAPVGFPGLPGPPTVIPVPDIFSKIPAACLPNFTTAISEAYVAKVDPTTGSVQDGQWIGGAALGVAGVAFAGGRVWISGSAAGPQAPISPGALMPQNLGPGFRDGAYLSAVDFLPAPPVSIACILDGGNFSHVGAVAAFQLISIVGTNLGPTTPVQAQDGASPLGGVSVTFDGAPAQLLYVSDSQINVAVPPPPVPSSPGPSKSSTVMQLTYNGAAVQRQFAFTTTNLNIFANLTTNLNPCPSVPSTSLGFQPLAVNADGSTNSCATPAKAGSIVSLFVHGAGGFGSPPPQLVNLHASLEFGCTALVTNAALISSFVYKVDVSLPASLAACGEDFSGTQGVPLTLSYNDAPVGPFYIPADLAGPVLNFSPPGVPMPMTVWISP